MSRLLSGLVKVERGKYFPILNVKRARLLNVMLIVMVKRFTFSNGENMPLEMAMIDDGFVSFY